MGVKRCQLFQDEISLKKWFFIRKPQCRGGIFVTSI